MAYLSFWGRTLDREIKGAVSGLLYEFTRFFHKNAAVESPGFYSYGSLFPFLTKAYRKFCSASPPVTRKAEHSNAVVSTLDIYL